MIISSIYFCRKRNVEFLKTFTYLELNIDGLLQEDIIILIVHWIRKDQVIYLSTTMKLRIDTIDEVNLAAFNTRTIYLMNLS